MRSGVLAAALVGCYAPAAVPGAPCSERLTCPGDQECDRTASPPVCRAPGAGGPDAGPDGPPDAPPIGPWSPPKRLWAPLGDEDDPTLTADMLELYFNRDNLAIWRTRRASLSAPWDPPVPVIELGEGTTPELSADGLTIYFGSNRDNLLLDIWRATRAQRSAPWQPPVRIAELSTVAEESNAAPSSDHLTLVLARRVLGQAMEVFLASRASLQAPWNDPVRVAELGSPAADGDGMLSADELSIYFYSTRTGSGDLYVATRASRGDAFGPPQPIAELNVPDALDQDPWISPDGRRMIFASERGGQAALYESTR